MPDRGHFLWVPVFYLGTLKRSTKTSFGYNNFRLRHDVDTSVSGTGRYISMSVLGTLLAGI